MSDIQKPTTPAITSANLPQQPTQPPAGAKAAPAGTVPAEEPIVAKPLVDADFTKIKPKNPALTLFWGNRIANKGLRIEDLCARGFRVAKPDECVMPGPNGTWVELAKGYVFNGQIQRGDLLALIIPKKDYEGQLRLNQQNADKRVSRAANAAKGQQELGSALREVGGLPARYRGKIGVYNPNTNDIGRLD